MSGRARSGERSSSELLGEGTEGEVEGVLNKVKALVEIFGGPQWKTHFMRKLKTYSGGAKNKKKRRMQFQYDPKSYALNFDDGIEKEEDGVYLDFSARYACPLGINIWDRKHG